MQINRQARNMMNQAQVRPRQAKPHTARTMRQFRKGRHAGDMPTLDLTLDLRRHEEVWGSVRLGRTVLHGCFVHVVAATVVLGAIATVPSQYGLTCVC